MTRRWAAMIPQRGATWLLAGRGSGVVGVGVGVGVGTCLGRPRRCWGAPVPVVGVGGGSPHHCGRAAWLHPAHWTTAMMSASAWWPRAACGGGEISCMRSLPVKLQDWPTCCLPFLSLRRFDYCVRFPVYGTNVTDLLAAKPKTAVQQMCLGTET